MVNQPTKRVMVSVIVHGIRRTVFAQGVVGPDGKTRVSMDVINRLTRQLARGETFTMG